MIRVVEFYLTDVFVRRCRKTYNEYYFSFFARTDIAKVEIVCSHALCFVRASAEYELSLYHGVNR